MNILQDNKKTMHTVSSLAMAKEIGNDGKRNIDFDHTFPIISNVFSFKHDFILTPNYHDYLEIGYIVEGKGFLSIANKKCPISKNDIILIGNHELHLDKT